MVHRRHLKLLIVRDCALPGVVRSSIYYHPRTVSEEDQYLMG